MIVNVPILDIYKDSENDIHFGIRYVKRSSASILLQLIATLKSSKDSLTLMT